MTMTKLREKEAQEALRRVYTILFGHQKNQEVSSFDFASRPYHWERDEENRWFCKHPPTHGRLCVHPSQFFWVGTVDRKRFEHKVKIFPRLEEAVTWIEHETAALAEQPEPPTKAPYYYPKEQIAAAQTRLRDKLHGGPYWIEPTALEPLQPTYQVIIEIDTKPTEMRVSETICEASYQYGVRYLSAAKLSRLVNLGEDLFEIEKPLGTLSGWFVLTSLTAFYLDSLAAAQAQKIWDESQITVQYKKGTINRARFGYLERETGYSLFLGGLEDPKSPWQAQTSREEHMADQALKQSLAYALDVQDYRDYLGMTEALVDDEKLLEGMHKIRTKTRGIPAVIRDESKKWLNKNKRVQILG